MKLHLPRYTVPRQRKGRVAFYFVVPEHLRTEGWPASIALPDDLQEVMRHAEMLNKRLDAEREGKTITVMPRGCISMIVRQYQNSADYKHLAPITRRGYEQSVAFLLKWCAKAGHPHIRHLTRPVILKYLDQFAAIPTTRKKIGGMLRIICAKAIDMGEITVNPALELNLKENRKPAHIYTDTEVETLARTAVNKSHPEMAKAIVTAYSIGQREADIMKLKTPDNYHAGIFKFTQNKTKEIMEIPAPQELRAFLDDAPAGFLIGKLFKDDWFRHVFAAVRDEAGLPKTAKFMHFRHSACVRLARAGCTVPEIAAISGHSLQSATAILKRYLPRDPEVARNAIKKLDKYQKKIRSTKGQVVDFKGTNKPRKVERI